MLSYTGNRRQSLIQMILIKALELSFSPGKIILSELFITLDILSWIIQSSTCPLISMSCLNDLGVVKISDFSMTLVT